ncbi:GNAT family N-acetyltransferase [Teichococcus cervicalis]|uniref:Acetyltransferase, GNAT family n=2 Tax=Teichococcus cervicalis TaxID=204525 RepID=D5RL02_9PROT|nr:GNAT family N-acetyltransferase [Pseudoroseomonas cervicalis]EFH12028.1 acetyltransferase, GNAT family [Pseudoroseomonas cervicalis ATCC 49957]
MIRPARPAEAPALAALAERAYAPYLPLIGRRPAPMDDDYAARIAANEAWVWDAGGLLALLVLERRADHLWLDNIAVAPEAQGRGLGRRLIRFAVAEAQRLGLPELRLLTNAAMAGNLALYPRLGFTEVARRHDEGFDRVFFQAKLEAIKA